MKPLVTFPDAQLAALDVLRVALPPHTTDTVTFGTKTLVPKKPNQPALPYVAVTIDSTVSGVMRADQTATLRLRVWHHSDAKGLVLAQRILGVLAAYAGDSNVRTFREGLGPISTEDPDTGAPLTYLTVVARLRPSPME